MIISPILPKDWANHAKPATLQFDIDIIRRKNLEIMTTVVERILLSLSEEDNIEKATSLISENEITLEGEDEYGNRKRQVVYWLKECTWMMLQRRIFEEVKLEIYLFMSRQLFGRDFPVRGKFLKNIFEESGVRVEIVLWNGTTSDLAADDKVRFYYKQIEESGGSLSSMLVFLVPKDPRLSEVPARFLMLPGVGWGHEILDSRNGRVVSPNEPWENLRHELTAESFPEIQSRAHEEVFKNGRVRLSLHEIWKIVDTVRLKFKERFDEIKNEKPKPPAWIEKGDGGIAQAVGNTKGEEGNQGGEVFDTRRGKRELEDEDWEGGVFDTRKGKRQAVEKNKESVRVEESVGVEESIGVADTPGLTDITEDYEDSVDSGDNEDDEGYDDFLHSLTPHRPLKRHSIQEY
ncbi:uncharacterized protein RCO7_08331 [Rhynchosporium graminicola]|uniref:Uncharacterized protein n=1 Tax=Rhynchosporium graminicola TaxID=2792576 RepID=A0A1E1KQM3_9HELO|nr:uncharacterized protein RCO7_08331 [Rhynchosporium commune]